MKTLGFFTPILLFLTLLQARVLPERSDTSTVAESEPKNVRINYALDKRAPPEGTQVFIDTANWEEAANNWCWYLLCVTRNQTWTWDPENADRRRRIDGAALQVWTDPAKYGLPDDKPEFTTSDECPPASTVQSGGGINIGDQPDQSSNFNDFATLFRRPPIENSQQGNNLKASVNGAGVQRVDWNLGVQPGNNFWLDFSSSSAKNQYWCDALSKGDTSKCEDPPKDDEATKGIHRTSAWGQQGKKATFEFTKGRF